MQRIPHAAHWGAFWALVEDGKLVGVEPYGRDPAPSPLIEAVKHWLDEDVRIGQPMVREGWLEKRERSDGAGRGRERFVPVTWEEATSLVAGEIDRVRTTFGNASIFSGSYGWTSCGRFHHVQTQTRRLMNCVGGYTAHKDTYSVGAGQVIARHVLGDNSGVYGEGVALDMVAKHADVVLALGAVSPRTAQVEAGGVARHPLEDNLRKIRDRGTRIVSVSPRRDDVPDWLGAEWWPIRPNTDAALLIGMAGEIVAAGLHDADFVARCCSGGDRFLAYLTGETDGLAKTAEWAAGITGLDAARIRELAQQMAKVRSFITVSYALQRQVHGEQPWWAAIALAAVAGQIGTPGGGVAFGIGSLGGIGNMSTVARGPAMTEGQRPIDSFIPVARITDLLEKPGQPFTYEGKDYTYPDTRLVYWSGGNPFHHHQDLNRLERAWAKPETIVVQEPLWTPTARRADIILPATTSLERNDIAGNRRSDHVCAMHKVVDPLGQSRPDYDILRAIADRLGVEAFFSEGRDEMAWLRHIYGQVRVDVLAKADVTLPEFDAFWQEGFIEVPVRTDYVHLGAFRENPESNPLPTESGRIVLFSETLADRGYADCPPHPIWMEPPEWLGAEKAAAHPFHLVSAQPNGRLHSQIDYGSVSQREKVAGREGLMIHPRDAARIGVKSGDTALLYNERGRCLAGVNVTEDVREGVAVLPTGAWFMPIDTAEGRVDNAGNPNILTLDLPSSAFSGGCSAHTCLVSITRYDGNLPPPDRKAYTAAELLMPQQAAE